MHVKRYKVQQHLCNYLLWVRCWPKIVIARLRYKNMFHGTWLRVYYLGVGTHLYCYLLTLWVWTLYWISQKMWIQIALVLSCEMIGRWHSQTYLTTLGFSAVSVREKGLTKPIIILGYGKKNTLLCISLNQSQKFLATLSPACSDSALAKLCPGGDLFWWNICTWKGEPCH